MNFIKIAQALLGRIPLPDRHRCNICGHRLSRFIPFRDERVVTITLPEVLDVIGSDKINFECPWCGSHDRERHLYMYMGKFGFFDSLPEMTVLHFAPEKRLSKLITSQNPILYEKCDLFPKGLDIKCVNILDIPYSDGSFDLVIANHVLEHVPDDLKALAEIHRIIKPGGYAILQTPFSAKLHKTWSDEGVDNDHARLIAYGQDDHVRLYGRDIFDRFTTTNLTPNLLHHKDILPSYDSRVYGVNAAEPFFLFKKEDASTSNKF
jgi:SAM-dependent methyltransferase